jgi:molybdopterin/thiamine biosynthesis adenylyltransferase
VPDAILMARYFGGGKLLRGSVERADAAWIHGRGQDPRFLRLQQMSVVLIGCGSVGAPIAIALAQAGVGRLVLVDFDQLKWANAGRHPLGAPAIGQNKAKALAEKLRVEFPHMTIESFEIDVDTMVRRHAQVLASGNLIVSATGNWSGERRLETWREESPSASVLYAWTEAHACAGHSVLLTGSAGCLRCGFGKTGVPNFEITEWPKGSLKTEPACGAVFQPYGSIELAFINATAAQLALDALLGEIHRSTHEIWVGDEMRLKELGGAWSKTWLQDSQFRAEGKFVFSRAWPTGNCARCRKAAAA